MKKERNYAIDVIKAIAIIGVLTIHTSSRAFDFPVGSYRWLYGLFWGVLARASVPVFFMCSGALLLEPNKSLSIKKLYTKNMLRIIVAMLFWAMAYKLYWMDNTGVSLRSLTQAALEILQFKQEFHLYYIHIMILVYIFLPITRAYTKNATKKQLQYFLAVWFVLGIFLPTMQSVCPALTLVGMPAYWLLNQAYAAIGYTVWGYYITAYPLKKRSIYLTGYAIGFGLSFIGTWVKSMQTGALYQPLLEGMSIGVALMAAGVFGFIAAKKTPYGNTTLKVAVHLSKASFCVYLVHLFFLYTLDSIGISHQAYYIPALVIGILAASLLVHLILSKIPILNRWIL